MLTFTVNYLFIWSMPVLNLNVNAVWHSFERRTKCDAMQMHVGCMYTVFVYAIYEQMHGLKYHAYICIQLDQSGWIDAALVKNCIVPRHLFECNRKPTPTSSSPCGAFGDSFTFISPRPENAMRQRCTSAWTWAHKWKLTSATG